MRLSRASALVALCAAAGCRSQWFAGYEHPDIARTDLVVRTEPSGASVRLVGDDGKTRQETAPFKMTIEYDHAETLYERQNNYGAKMREDMSPVVEVLTFPVWAVASFFHYREEKRVNTYGHNRFAATAFAPGCADAEQTIVLEGEAVREVEMKLEPLKR